MTDNRKLLLEGVEVSAEEFVAYYREKDPSQLRWWNKHPAIEPLLEPHEKLSNEQQWMFPGG